MIINDRTKKLIEIDRVLQSLVIISPYGQKKKQQMQPFDDEEALCQVFDHTEKLIELLDKQSPMLKEIRGEFRQLKDLRKIIEQLQNGIVLSSVELFELKIFADIVKNVSKNMAMLHWRIPDKYRIGRLLWLEEILDPDNTGIKTFYVYDGYSEELAKVRRKRLELEKKIDENRRHIIKGLEEKLEIPFRITGEASISKKNHDLVEKMKTDDTLQSIGETYMNINFKIKDDHVTLELKREVDHIKIEEVNLEAEVLEKLSLRINEGSAEILANMDGIGEFDLLLGRAAYAVQHKCTKPIIKKGSYIMEGGRHPIVEENLKKQKKTYTPIDIVLNKGVTLITGANMGGKTVSLKLAGLLLTMVHYGIFPTAEKLVAPLCNHITIVAGDEQDIDKGLSTFGAEIESINETLQRENSNGLILIDELARGTNPKEGFAISAAIINHLKNKNDMTLITTHYDGLVTQGIKHLQVKGLRSIDFKTLQNTDKISDFMDYSLIEITDDKQVPKDAINIARFMGLPKEIIEYAEKIIGGETIEQK